jgi:hypothetical protein
MGVDERRLQTTMNRIALSAALLLVVTTPLHVHAQNTPQAGVRISGHVVEAGSGAGVAQAEVIVNGRTMTTTGDGSFSFTNVEPGPIDVTVKALGYATWDGRFVAQRDTTITVVLEIAAVELPAVAGTGATVQLRGEVQDAGTGAILTDVDVFSAAGGRARTNNIGQFKIRIPQSVSGDVAFEAFAYLPLTINLTAAADTSVVIRLAPDSVALRMIAAAVERLRDRAGPACCRQVRDRTRRTAEVARCAAAAAPSAGGVHAKTRVCGAG